MFKKEDCYIIGSFTKTHGVEGELVLRKNSDLLEKYKLESVLIDIDGGLVPFFISPNGLQVRNHSTLRIKLDDINTERKATRFIGCDLYVQTSHVPDIMEEQDFDLDLLIGFHVIDSEHGDLGTIEAVHNYTGNILLQLTINNQEVLIPFVEDNLVDIDEKNKTINLQTPEGLLDIYL